MNALSNWKKERDAALLSLDRERIERYAAKYGVPYPKNANDLVFWGSVYKAICNMRNAPDDVVQIARTWLAAHHMREQITFY